MLAGARACAKVPERETYGGGEAGEEETGETGESGEESRGCCHIMLYGAWRRVGVLCIGWWV